MTVEFEEKAKSVMDEVLSWDPAYATQVGWHRYDHILADPSPTAQHRQAERCAELVSELKAYTEDSLSEEEAIDRDLAIHILQLKRFEKTELRPNEHFSNASNEIGNSLIFLFARRVPPLRRRLEALSARIERIPEHLEKAARALVAPYRAWNEAVLESGEKLPLLLKSIRSMANRKCGDVLLRRRISKGVSEAIEAIEEHNAWLRKDVIPMARTKETVAFDLFSKYFQLNGYPLTPDEALKVAEAHLRRIRADMTKAAKAWDSSATVEAALEAMKGEHPEDFEGVLRAYRRAVARAKEFVVRKGLVTVPRQERLVVMETPEFMKPFTPFAAQYEPGKFDNDRTGWFMVTTDKGNRALLREHNLAAIVNTAVHEAYPGHHLHGICANTNPSYIRTIMASPEFSEGWGLYSEELMVGAGFNDDPFGRLVTGEALRYRVARLILDVRLAKGELSIESGAKLLRDICGIESGAARIEARSCAMYPTYFSSYLIGKLGVLQLREDVERALGPKFSLRRFHDWMLYSGAMPLSFVRRAVANRMRTELGIELGPPRESLYEFAMRRARAF